MMIGYITVRWRCAARYGNFSLIVLEISSSLGLGVK